MKRHIPTLINLLSSIVPCAGERERAVGVHGGSTTTEVPASEDVPCSKSSFGADVWEWKH